jgi:hypothetical protein
MEIEVSETSKGTYNTNNGFVTWKFDLKPAETKNFKLVYSVKYPKDKELILE